MADRQPRLPVVAESTDAVSALGEIGRYGVAPAAQYAWWMGLERWVWDLRGAYAHLWPDDGIEVGQAARQRQMRGTRYRSGFPLCWSEHAGFVEDLVALKVWQEMLLRGGKEGGGARGWADWAMFLREGIAPAAGAIAGPCHNGHQEVRWLYDQDRAAAHAQLEASVRRRLGLPRRE